MRASEMPSESDDVADRRHVRLRELGRVGLGAEDRLRDDLDERDAGAVVVDERVLGALDAAGRAADVRELARVLFHVGALDRHREDAAVRELDLDRSLERDRLVVLRDLVVLRRGRGRSSSCARSGSTAAIEQPSASPSEIEYSTASPLTTGSEPGRPRQTGVTSVFGSAPWNAEFAGFGAARTSWSWCSARRAPRGRAPARTARGPCRSPSVRAWPSDGALLGREQSWGRDRVPGRAAVRPTESSEQLLERARPRCRDARPREPARGTGCRRAGRPRGRGRTGSRCRARRRGSPGSSSTSLRYICIGSSIFSPSLNAVVGAEGVARRRRSRTRRRSRAG